MNKDNRKYRLIYEYEKQHSYFQDAYIYIPSFFQFLLDQPQIIAKLIINSNIEDVKNNLAFFFMNNFYENILSSSFIEDNLIYVITLVLMDEIKNIKTSNDFNFFLDNTAGGYFLEQLNFKMDVMNYYKSIMVNLVENLENMSSSKKINFNVQKIQEDFLKMKEIMEARFQKTGEKINIIDNQFFRRNFLNDYEKYFGKENVDNSSITTSKFNSYIPEITKEEIEQKISENKGNQGMKEYCDKLIQNLKSDKNIYSTEAFLSNVSKSTSYQEVLALYQIDFFKVMKIIDELFKRNIRVDFVDNKVLDRKVDGLHQGIILDIDEIKTYELDELLDMIKDKEGYRTIVMLDHLEDPHNFGAIIRTCEAAGIKSIIIPKDRSVSVTGTVMKTSAGALEHVNIAMVNNLVNVIDEFKENGFFVYAADMDGVNYKKVNYADKVLLVIGSEGNGVGRLVKKNCDEILAIPQYGKVNSLNASVAAAILIYGIVNR